MINLSNEIQSIVLAVFTQEATNEDIRKLKDLCYQQDSSGDFFSKLSDREWIRTNLIVFDKIDIPQAKKEVWERIQRILPPEEPLGRE